MGSVVKFWTRILDKVEPEISIELEEIVYSKKHGHEICVMHIVGKNVFPKMTAEEILTNPKARAGLSKEDLITIAKLDTEIMLRKDRLRVKEFDRNGTIIVEDAVGQRMSYSEKLISESPDMLDKLAGKDAHRIGYRVGLKEGLKLSKTRQLSIRKILSLFGIKQS